MAWGHWRGWPRKRFGRRGLTLPMLEQRLPQIMADIMSQIAEPIATGCWASAARLDREGFVGGPSWSDFRCPTPRSTICTTWRVATWVAVSRVFFFRTPCPEDRGSCPIISCRPGSLAVALWPVREPGFDRLSHITRIRSETAFVPHPRA